MSNQPMNPEIRKRVIQFQQTFNTESGKEVLKDLAGYCRVLHPSFIKRSGEQADPLEMAFLDGRKDLFLYIKRIIDLDLPPE